MPKNPWAHVALVVTIVAGLVALAAILLLEGFRGETRAQAEQQRETEMEQLESELRQTSALLRCMATDPPPKEPFGQTGVWSFGEFTLTVTEANLARAEAEAFNERYCYMNFFANASGEATWQRAFYATHPRFGTVLGMVHAVESVDSPLRQLELYGLEGQWAGKYLSKDLSHHPPRWVAEQACVCDGATAWQDDEVGLCAPIAYAPAP